MKNLLVHESQGRSEKSVMIKLGPEINNIFMSKVCSYDCYALVGPWGGEK